MSAPNTGRSPVPGPARRRPGSSASAAATSSTLSPSSRLLPRHAGDDATTDSPASGRMLNRVGSAGMQRVFRQALRSTPRLGDDDSAAVVQDAGDSLPTQRSNRSGVTRPPLAASPRTLPTLMLSPSLRRVGSAGASSRSPHSVVSKLRSAVESSSVLSSLPQQSSVGPATDVASVGLAQLQSIDTDGGASHLHVPLDTHASLAMYSSLASGPGASFYSSPFCSSTAFAPLSSPPQRVWSSQTDSAGPSGRYIAVTSTPPRSTEDAAMLRRAMNTHIPSQYHCYVSDPAAPSDPAARASAVFDTSERTWRYRLWPACTVAPTRRDFVQLLEWCVAVVCSDSVLACSVLAVHRVSCVVATVVVVCSDSVLACGVVMCHGGCWRQCRVGAACGGCAGIVNN